MECPNCSASILDHAKVCPFCQTRLNHTPIKDIETKNDRPKKTNTKLIKIISNKTKKAKKRDVTDNSFNADNFDISYTINSAEQAQFIRDIVNNVGSSSNKSHNRPNEFKHSTKHKKRRVSNKTRRCIFFSIVAVIVLLLLCWGCSAVFNAINGNKSDNALIYIKNNTLMVSASGISQEISDCLIDSDAYKNSTTVDEEDSSETDVEVKELTSDKVIELVNKYNLIYRTDDSQYIYFLSNFNISTNLGSLKCFDTKKKKIIDIAENISNCIKVSNDGKRLMFLQKADASGNAGMLCYRNITEKKMITISEDIDRDMYIFSENTKKVLFLGNFEHSVQAGELYEYDITNKNAEREKIDSDVSRIFGTNRTGDIYIYAKDFNISRNCYDIYKKELKKERVKLIEESVLPPVISNISDEMYMYGGNSGDTHNLYLVNIKTNEKKKIASEISDIVQISDDEKSILYRKIFNGATSDYYIYTKGNAEPQKIAYDVTIIPDDSKFSGIPQISISDDFSSITYISGFDIEKGKGVLYQTHYTGNSVKESEKITDEAFLCHYSYDGSRIIYAKNYSVTRDVVDIYSFENADSTLIKEEIGYNLFEISKTGDNIICIDGFNTVGEYGKLEIIDRKNNSKKVLDDVSAFYLLNDTSIVMLKNYNKELKCFDIYLTDKNNDAVKLDKDVTYVINN